MEEARSRDTVKRIVKDTAAYLCIDCSKCTGSCPIGQAGSVYSPRALVQHLVLEERDPSQIELWRCLTCGLCKERCPSNVDYPRFISMLRQMAFARGVLPPETHGGTIRELMRIMAHPGLNLNRTAWLPDWVEVVAAEATTDDIYFVGCAPYFDIIFEDFQLDLMGTHRAGLELLRSYGILPAVLKNERCCGHDALWSGDTELFLQLARRNVDLVRQAGAKRVFISCPEGYHTFAQEYPRHLGELGFEVVNTVRFLAQEGALAATDHGDITVTYHDSCRMGRFSSIYDEPRQLIQSTPGVRLSEMEFSRDQAACCGSNLWINCDSVSKRMQMNLLEAARRTGSQLMLTACDKCRIHLACAQMENGSVAAGIKTDNILRFLHRKGVRKS